MLSESIATLLPECPIAPSAHVVLRLSGAFLLLMIASGLHIKADYTLDVLPVLGDWAAAVALWAFAALATFGAWLLIIACRNFIGHAKDPRGSAGLTFYEADALVDEKRRIGILRNSFEFFPCLIKQKGGGRYVGSVR